MMYKLGFAALVALLGAAKAQLVDQNRKSIAAAEYGACFIRYEDEEEGGKIYCWDTTYDEVGFGSYVYDAETYVPVEMTLIPDHLRFVSITTTTDKYYTNYAGLTTDGALWLWGYYYYNMADWHEYAGGFSVEIDYKGEPLLGDHWIAITMSEYYTCAIRDSGDLYCWTESSSGYPGSNIDTDNDGTYEEYDYPMLVAGGHKWKYVVTNDDQGVTYGVTVEGDLYCWGSAEYCGLELPSSDPDILEPKVVSKGGWESVKTVYAGDSFNPICGVRNGDLYCWTETGEVSVVTDADTPEAQDMGKFKGEVVDYALNYGGICVILTEDENLTNYMVCKGYENYEGMFGLTDSVAAAGDAVNEWTEVPTHYIPGFKKWLQWDGGEYVSCGLVELHDGTQNMYCTGDDAYIGVGDLGDSAGTDALNDDYYDGSYVNAYVFPINTEGMFGELFVSNYEPMDEHMAADPDTTSTIWTLFTAFGIFLYQLSTSQLVAARAPKSNIFVVQQINLAVGIIAWYLLGYAFSYGISLDEKQENKFIGNYVFALHRIREENHNTTSHGYAWFIQSFFYALVCNSIVAEALGARASTTAHAVSTTYTVSFLFPVIAHWVWSTNGWLSAIRPQTVVPLGTVGAIDFAGSGVVHVLGASIALAGSMFLKGEAKEESEDNALVAQASSGRLFAALCFVTGASISIVGDAEPEEDHLYRQIMAGRNIPHHVIFDHNDTMFEAVGRAAVCLTLSVAASSIVVLLLESLLTKTVTMRHAVNALTIGFAAICSNVLTCEPWAAILCGIIAGLIYVGGRRAFKKLGDNDVFAIHGLGGIWGLLFTGILAKPKFMRDVIGANFYPARVAVSYVLGNDVGEIEGISNWTRHSGVFYPTGKNGKSSSPNGKLLACMILEAVIILAWGFLMALPLFVVLKAVKKLRAADSAYSVSKTDA